VQGDSAANAAHKKKDSLSHFVVKAAQNARNWTDRAVPSEQNKPERNCSGLLFCGSEISSQYG